MCKSTLISSYFKTYLLSWVKAEDLLWPGADANGNRTRRTVAKGGNLFEPWPFNKPCNWVNDSRWWSNHPLPPPWENKTNQEWLEWFRLRHKNVRLKTIELPKLNTWVSIHASYKRLQGNCERHLGTKWIIRHKQIFWAILCIVITTIYIKESKKLQVKSIAM